MDLKLLEDFIVLAEQRNFTRTAEIRNVTQATLSRRIQALEHWVGTDLVKRGVYPAKLTQAGEELLASTSDSVQQLLRTRAAIRSRQFEAMSQVKIAAPYTIALTGMGQFLHGLKRKPGDSILFLSGHANELTNRFIGGQSDILLCYDHPSLELGLTDYCSKHCLLGNETLGVYAGRTSPWAGKDLAEFNPKDAIPLCSYGEATFFGQIQEVILGRVDGQFAYKVATQSELSSVIKSNIENNFGVGWLPGSLVGQKEKSDIVKISPPAFELEIQIRAYLAPGKSSPAVSRVWAQISGNA